MSGTNKTSNTLSERLRAAAAAPMRAIAATTLLATAITVGTHATPAAAAVTSLEFYVVSDGLPTFDPTNDPGFDTDATNDIVRTHDRMVYRATVTTDAGANPLILTVTLPVLQGGPWAGEPAAVWDTNNNFLNFEVPPLCTAGGNATPGAGATTAITNNGRTLRCDLGNYTNPVSLAIDLPAMVSGRAPNGETINIEGGTGDGTNGIGQVSVTSGADPAFTAAAFFDHAGPGGTVLPSIETTITAAPMWDFRKERRIGNLYITNNLDAPFNASEGPNGEPGFFNFYSFSLVSNRLKGSEALDPAAPFVFEDDFSGLPSGTIPVTWPISGLGNNNSWNANGCYNYLTYPYFPFGNPVPPSGFYNTTTPNQTFNSGWCTGSTAGTTFTGTTVGLDTSLLFVPTSSGIGDNPVVAGEYYSWTKVVPFWTPADSPDILAQPLNVSVPYDNLASVPDQPVSISGQVNTDPNGDLGVAPDPGTPNAYPTYNQWKTTSYRVGNAALYDKSSRAAYTDLSPYPPAPIDPRRASNGIVNFASPGQLVTWTHFTTNRGTFAQTWRVCDKLDSSRGFPVDLTGYWSGANGAGLPPVVGGLAVTGSGPATLAAVAQSMTVQWGVRVSLGGTMYDSWNVMGNVASGADPEYYNPPTSAATPMVQSTCQDTGDGSPEAWFDTLAEVEAAGYDLSQVTMWRATMVVPGGASIQLQQGAVANSNHTYDVSDNFLSPAAPAETYVGGDLIENGTHWPNYSNAVIQVDGLDDIVSGNRSFDVSISYKTNTLVQKTASPVGGSLVSPGQTITYTLSPVHTTLDNPQAQDVTVTDVLPPGVRYLATVAAPGPVSVQADTPAAGYTTLIWVYEDQLANSPMAPIVFTARNETQNPDGYQFTNHVLASAGASDYWNECNYVTPSSLGYNGTTTPGSFRGTFGTDGYCVKSDSVSHQVSAPPGMQLFKEVLTPTQEVNNDVQFRVNYAAINVTPSPDGILVVDVFPWNGDGRTPATSYDGTFELVDYAAEEQLATLVEGVDYFVYFTGQLPSDIVTDPGNPANNLPAAPAWCLQSNLSACGMTSLADATGMLVHQPTQMDLGETYSVLLTFETLGNRGGDVYTNNFTLSDVDGTLNTVFSNDVHTDVVESTLGDYVWWDLNGDGQQDANEPPVAGVTVLLFEADGVTPVDIDPLTPGVQNTAVTDADGWYLFGGLSSGGYVVRVDTSGQLAGSFNSGDPDGGNDAESAVALGINAADLAQDFGFLGAGTIGDTVWLDSDGDGVQDLGEPGLEGFEVLLEVDLDGDGVADYTWTTVTDADGMYLFEGLPPGDYTVTVVAPPVGLSNSGDPDGGADSTSMLTLAAGEENLDQDFGYQPLFSLGDRVWSDVDGDGVFTVGVDIPAPDGTVVELRAADGTLITSTMVMGGLYLFEELPAGEYYVQVPASQFTSGPLVGWVAAPGGTPEPDDDVDDSGDHNAYDGVGGASLSGVRTGLITLSVTVAPGTVTGDEPGGFGFSNTTLDLALLAPAGISIEKEVCSTGNTCDPDAALGAGGWVESHLFAFTDEVTWRIIVTNTGAQDLVDVAVTDVLVPSCAMSIGDLAVGASVTYTCTTSNLLVAIDPNTAEVTGESVTGAPVEDADTASALLPNPDPGLTIVKSVNGDDANMAPGVLVLPGADLSFEYLVTNTGNVPLTKVTVTDDQGVVVTCPASTLDVGESFTCTGGPVPAPEGQYTNIGTATGIPVTGGPELEADDPANAFGATTGIAIVKIVQTLFAADEPTGPQVAVGDTVKWTYTVTNTGNVALADVSVTDDQGVAVNCGDGTNVIALLAAGASHTCYGWGVATVGQYVNTGYTVGVPVDENGDPIPFLDKPEAKDPAHYFGADPAIDIEKHVNTVDADAAPGPVVVAGSAVTFTFTVTNTGNVPLTNVVVTDNVFGAVVCPATSLAVGESMVCTKVVPAVAGAHTNTATVTGDGPDTVDANGDIVDGDTVTDNDPANYFGSAPAISVVKTVQTLFDANTPTGPLVAEGGVVRWTYTVTNTGNVPLTNVALVDDVEGAITCPQTSLAVAGSMVCTLDGVATSGQYDNTGTVTGQGPDVTNTDGSTSPGEIVSDNDPAHYFGADPAIDVEKTVQTFDADVAPFPLVAEGDVVKYTYTVTNTGNVPLTGVRIVDDKIANDSLIACDVNGNNVIGTLQPGESSVCEYFTTAVAGGVTNIATATGRGPSTVGPDGSPVTGEVVSDTDPATYVTAQPAVDVEKSVQTLFDADTPTGPLVAEGATVRWTYTVTNTGNVPLTAVEVVDSVEGAITCPQDTLAVAEVMTCTLDGVAIEGQYMNTATVTAVGPETVDQDGLPVDGAEVTDDDDAHYFGSVPEIEIVKYTQTLDNDVPTGVLIADGGVVRWTYKVTNTGNVPLTGVTVVDTVEGAVTCPKTDLAVGEVMTCTLDGVAEPGQYMNTGEVTGVGPETVDENGDPVDGVEVTDDNPDHYFGVVNAIDVVKTVQTSFDANTAADGPMVATGSTVLWTYTVTNTGNSTLVDVALVDTIEGAITCPKTTLAPAEVMVCTHEGVAIAGGYTNTGEVTGTGPETVDENGDAVDGEEVTADDPAHYFGADPAVSIVKRVNGADANTAPGIVVLPGSTMNFTYEVTNTGNVALTDVTVVDDMGVVVICPSTALAVDESMTCTGTGVAPLSGTYTNIGTVNGTGPDTVGPDGEPVDGETVTDDDPANAWVPAPSIEIIKFVNDLDANDAPGPELTVGANVLFTYQVTNTGNVPLENVTVLDDKGVLVNCGFGGGVIPLLGVGETRTCQGPAVVVEGPYVNIGTASGNPVIPTHPEQPEPPVFERVTDSDPAHYLGKKSQGSGGNPPGTIPNTGSSITGSALAWSAVLAVSGLMLIFVGRRRRHTHL